jgi:hypothetical protein
MQAVERWQIAGVLEHLAEQMRRPKSVVEADLAKRWLGSYTPTGNAVLLTTCCSTKLE